MSFHPYRVPLDKTRIGTLTQKSSFPMFIPQSLPAAGTIQTQHTPSIAPTPEAGIVKAIVLVVEDLFMELFLTG